jgi:hypothetical protein
MSDPEGRSCPPELRLIAKPEHDRGEHSQAGDVLRTLRHLERRMRTGHLDPVNIRDVQQLAALGLAEHDRSGWRPTAAGLAYLQQCKGSFTSKVSHDPSLQILK